MIGEVKINPGDYVFGDIDGVICIPKEIIDDVINQAEEVKEKEDIVRGELSAGKNIRDLFEKYKVFQFKKCNKSKMSRVKGAVTKN